MISSGNICLPVSTVLQGQDMLYISNKSTVMAKCDK
jgi:hypothetical protein